MLACGGSEANDVGSADAASGGSGGGAGQDGSGGAAGTGGHDVGPPVPCGTGYCSFGQICCPGCEPGTGSCSYGGCPGSACPIIIDAGTEDAAPDATELEACNGISCDASEICVYPSCGGGILPCEPPSDAGECPQGWSRGTCAFSGEGCIPPPCTPPPAFCAPRPAACPASKIDCSCLPDDVCTHEGRYGGSCGFVSGREVMCLSA